MLRTLLPGRRRRTSFLAFSLVVAAATTGATQEPRARFHLEDATIAQIQHAIVFGEISTVGLVELYLRRIKAYNGACVSEPQGMLGPIATIPRAGQINALSTLNLRPAARKTWGFDDRKARSMTDRVDDSRRHAGRARSGRGAGRPVQTDRPACRSAARRRDGDQGSVRHLRPAHDVGRRRAVRERPAARRRDVRQAAARRRRDHPRQGQHGRVRDRWGAQLVRRNVLQSIRHRTRARDVERGIGHRRWRPIW